MTSSRKPSLSKWSSKRPLESLPPRRERTTARVVSDCFAHDVRNAATIAVMNAQHMSEQLSAARRLLEGEVGRLKVEGEEEHLPAESTRKLRRILSELEASCEDCSAGIGHIVNLASDLDRVGVEMQRMDIASLVQSAVAIVSAQVRLKARMITELEPTMLDCHPGRLTQMLVNLMLNAAQACCSGPDKDFIRVIAATKNGMFCLTVEDSGRGIEACDLEKIFEPYVTRRQDGNGLGLALCRTIAREHDGELTCQSVVGQGTIFRFEMPVGPSRVGSHPTQQKDGLL